jgi:predicted nucleic acid-binding protein
MEPCPAQAGVAVTGIMSFLHDTDICSAYLKGNPDVQNRFIQYGGRLQVSVITVGELFSGVLSARASPGC